MSNPVTSGLADRVQALEDRIAVEEVFLDYFDRFEKRGGVEGYFTDDIELDMEGNVTSGLTALKEEFPRIAAMFPRRIGQLRMQITNFIIKVDGNTTTAQFIMTQTLNDNPKGIPRHIKQSRDFDWLTKDDGQWKISKRVVISDSGLYDGQDESWSRRGDFIIGL